MQKQIKNLAFLNSFILLIGATYCALINQFMYASIIPLSAILTYFLWVKYLSRNEIIAGLCVSIAGVLLYIIWQVPLGVEVPIFMNLLFITRSASIFSQKVEIRIFYSYSALQTFFLVAFSIIAFYQGSLSFEEQNSSIIGDIIYYTQCAPDDEVGFSGNVDPHKGTVSGQILNAPILMMISAGMKATVGASAMAGSSKAGPVFTNKGFGIIAAKAVKTTKIGIWVGGSVAVSSALYDVFKISGKC